MSGLLQKAAWLALFSTAAWLALHGCAARSGPSTYRLVNQNDQRILIPPGVKDAGVSRRTFDIRTTADARSCDGHEGGVELQQRRRGGLRLTVERHALQQQPAGWLAQWATSLEQRGCITPGESFGLATSVAQAVPLELPIEQRLLNPDARSSGYTDLRPGYKLRVVSPVFREGAPPDATVMQEETKVEASEGGLTVVGKASPDLIGYQIAWYAVEPRARGGGARIVPQFAEYHSEGEVTRQNAPHANYLTFDRGMAYFRMLFMARRTESNDHDILVMAAPTQANLEERTRALEAGTQACMPAASRSEEALAEGEGVTDETANAIARTPRAASQTVLPAPPTPAGASQSACIIAPKQVAIVAWLRVTVQDKEVLVHPGATLGNALREAGANDPEEVLPTLAVRKPYEGRLTPVAFPRATRDILALPLSGGEEIRW